MDPNPKIAVGFQFVRTRTLPNLRQLILFFLLVLGLPGPHRLFTVDRASHVRILLV
jgi:hypothetical protein